MWLFGTDLHKNLPGRYVFLFTFVAFVPLIQSFSEMEWNVLGFNGRMTFVFLGWQPLSPGLFPLGYFLLISSPLYDFFSTDGTHISLKTETHAQINGCEFNMHSTCLSRIQSLKNNRAIWMNPKTFINSNHP